MKMELIQIPVFYTLLNRSESEDAHTSRSQDWRNSIIIYRSAQIMHILAMEAFQFLLQIYIVGAELMILAMLFVFIRNLSPVTFNALVSSMVGVAGLMCLKLALGCASRINDFSTSISKTVKRASKEENAILRSFKPMVIRVGNTFTVTSESFPNILNYILSNLVNLLVTFKK